MMVVFVMISRNAVSEEHNKVGEGRSRFYNSSVSGFLSEYWYISIPLLMVVNSMMFVVYLYRHPAYLEIMAVEDAVMEDTRMT